LLQPLPEAAEVAVAVEAVDAAYAEVAAAVAVFEAVAGCDAPVSVERESGIAIAIGPPGCRRLVSASWKRARCPRSSRSHRRSRLLARWCYGIAVRQLKLPGPS
jgi:hypothetical protein